MIAGASALSSSHIWYSDVPGGVLSCQGSSFVPLPVAIVVTPPRDVRAGANHTHRVGKFATGVSRRGITKRAGWRADACGEFFGGDGGGSNSSSRAFSRRPTTSVSNDLSSIGRSAIGSVLTVPFTFPCGLCYRLRDLVDSASPLNDASTTRGEGAASTLTLPP